MAIVSAVATWKIHLCVVMYASRLGKGRYRTQERRWEEWVCVAWGGRRRVSRAGVVVWKVRPLSSRLQEQGGIERRMHSKTDLEVAFVELVAERPTKHR